MESLPGDGSGNPKPAPTHKLNEEDPNLKSDSTKPDSTKNDSISPHPEPGNAKDSSPKSARGSERVIPKLKPITGRIGADEVPTEQTPPTQKVIRSKQPTAIGERNGVGPTTKSEQKSTPATDKAPALIEKAAQLVQDFKRKGSILKTLRELQYIIRGITTGLVWNPGFLELVDSLKVLLTTIPTYVQTKDFELNGLISEG
jgi:hypothetical protein